MTEHTTTVGDTEVTIEETENGFEVTKAEPQDGSIEKFKEDSGLSEGTSLTHGAVDTIANYGDSKVKVEVNNENNDVFRSSLVRLQDTSWIVNEIEFEYGYVKFLDTDC